VGFESWLERDHVLHLDFDPSVVGLASQPLWLYWTDEGGSIEVFLQVNPAAQASFSKPAASAPDVPLRSPSWRGLVTVVLGTGRMGIPDRSAGQGAQLLCRPSELRPGARHRRPRR
jgi:hypothetical protein